MASWGSKLRSVRKELGFSLRDVYEASVRLAANCRNKRLIIYRGRLSAIERENDVPTIFHLYSLAKIYRRDIEELLALYGLSNQ